jgi:diaminopimelate epimerase
MHGAGNDFVLLDLRRQKLELDARMAAALAERHTGVGCDQLLVVRDPAAGGLARFEVWNADGSRAEQCGNGVRCIALYLRRRGEATMESFLLEGPTGEVRARCLDHGFAPAAPVAACAVEVDMGRPGLAAEEIPTTLPVHEGAVRLSLGGRQLQLGVVSMGNPHAVLLAEEWPEPMNDAAMAELGKTISAHAAFPEGCNVGFARIAAPDRIELHVHERGSGPTRACGSGACAAAVYARRLGRVGDSVHVIQPGGVLIIGTGDGAGPVTMTGPAQHVFEGILA